MVSEFVTKAEMKVTLMFKYLSKLGQIPYAVFSVLGYKSWLPWTFDVSR